MEPDTNRLVHMYRTLRLKEWDIELSERELMARISGLSKPEFMRYADATQEIDAAMDETQQIINQSQWAHSTQKQQMHIAANRAGRDKEKV